jgi:hypothetical protein
MTRDAFPHRGLWSGGGALSGRQEPRAASPFRRPSGAGNPLRGASRRAGGKQGLLVILSERLEEGAMAGEEAPQADRRPLEPSVPLAVQQELLAKLLATRTRDLEAVESVHPGRLAAGPGLHRRLLRWLAQQKPDSPHLGWGWRS